MHSLPDGLTAQNLVGYFLGSALHAYPITYPVDVKSGTSCVDIMVLHDSGEILRGWLLRVGHAQLRGGLFVTRDDCNPRV